MRLGLAKRFALASCFAANTFLVNISLAQNVASMQAPIVCEAADAWRVAVDRVSGLQARDLLGGLGFKTYTVQGDLTNPIGPAAGDDVGNYSFDACNTGGCVAGDDACEAAAQTGCYSKECEEHQAAYEAAGYEAAGNEEAGLPADLENTDAVEPIAAGPIAAEPAIWDLGDDDQGKAIDDETAIERATATYRRLLEDPILTDLPESDASETAISDESPADLPRDDFAGSDERPDDLPREDFASNDSSDLPRDDFASGYPSDLPTEDFAGNYPHDLPIEDGAPSIAVVDETTAPHDLPSEDGADGVVGVVTADSAPADLPVEAGVESPIRDAIGEQFIPHDLPEDEQLQDSSVAADLTGDAEMSLADDAASDETAIERHPSDLPFDDGEVVYGEPAEETANGSVGDEVSADEVSADDLPPAGDYPRDASGDDTTEGATTDADSTGEFYGPAIDTPATEWNEYEGHEPTFNPLGSIGRAIITGCTDADSTDTNEHPASESVEYDY